MTIRLGIYTSNDSETGYVREVWGGSEGNPRQLVLENGHWGYARNATLHEPKQNSRPLVGPAPTPPAAPKILAPFVTDSDLYATVYDASNRPVLSLDTVQLREMGLTTEELEKFATYVATALNASVFTED